MIHAPDDPFGCVMQWGARADPLLPIARTHVCNLASDHDGPHVCTCGEEMGRERDDPR